MRLTVRSCSVANYKGSSFVRSFIRPSVQLLWSKSTWKTSISLMSHPDFDPASSVSPLRLAGKEYAYPMFELLLSKQSKLIDKYVRRNTNRGCFT